MPLAPRRKGAPQIAFFLLLTVGVSFCAQAQQSPPPPVSRVAPTLLTVPRVGRAPQIADYLDSNPHPPGVQVTDFRQREPGDGVPVSRPTTAYLSYDDHNLYVVFVCQETPAQLRARMAKREDVFSDDRVGVFLDTFHDRQRAYAFLSNPLGIQLDGITTEGQGTDYSFDTLWHSEGRLTPDGFVVWMAIPFKSLRFSRGGGQVWGIGLGRLIPRNSEASYWPYVTKREEGFVSQLGRLEGLERISPGRNLQFIPYGLFARARFLDTAASTGPAFVTDNEARAGLDAKIVLRDAFTVDVALNPDFSQVESDEPQVTINQRFEVFFPEKRPFFIENAGFFETRQNLFFTRRVVDPQFGVRLTGRARGWTLGALAMDDRAPGRLAPISTLADSRGDRAGIFVARVRREFHGQSYVGALVSTRDVGEADNRVYSLDTRLKLTPNWFFSGQVTRSEDRAADGTGRSGMAYLAEISHTGRHFRYFSRYTDRDPDFRVPLGFVPRVDIRTLEYFADYAWRPENRLVTSYGPTSFALVNWDHTGRVNDWIARLGFGAGLTGQSLVDVAHTQAFELFRGFEFRKRRTDVRFISEWLKWLGVSANAHWGTSVNFFPGPGLDPFLADTSGASVQLTFRPVPRVRLDQTYIYLRLATGSRPTPGVPAGRCIFNNHLVRTKLNYQFTRELSLRAILDYNAVLPSPDLVALSRSKRLAGDVLLTYLIHPGTALHVGYTDIYDNLALDPGDPPTLRRTGSPTTSTGRQFFVKMSYLFRF